MASLLVTEIMSLMSLFSLLTAIVSSEDVCPTGNTPYRNEHTRAPITCYLGSHSESACPINYTCHSPPEKAILNLGFCCGKDVDIFPLRCPRLVRPEIKPGECDHIINRYDSYTNCTLSFECIVELDHDSKDQISSLISRPGCKWIHSKTVGTGEVQYLEICRRTAGCPSIEKLETPPFGCHLRYFIDSYGCEAAEVSCPDRDATPAKSLEDIDSHELNSIYAVTKSLEGDVKLKSKFVRKDIVPQLILDSAELELEPLDDALYRFEEDIEFPLESQSEFQVSQDDDLLPVSKPSNIQFSSQEINFEVLPENKPEEDGGIFEFLENLGVEPVFPPEIYSSEMENSRESLEETIVHMNNIPKVEKHIAPKGTKSFQAKRIISEEVVRERSREVQDEDEHDYCCLWARKGECDSNPHFMKYVCRKSCGSAHCSEENLDSCRAVANTADCNHIFVVWDSEEYTLSNQLADEGVYSHVYPSSLRFRRP